MWEIFVHGCMQQEIVWINYECGVHSTASRDVLPDCSAGLRRNSQNGVGTETRGRSTSSLQSPGIIHHYFTPPFSKILIFTFPVFFLINLLSCDTDVHQI